MDKDALLALADRVEKLAGTDREVDRAIMEALGLKPDYATDWGPRDNFRPAPFAYTASLDAAMTIVPDGWGWTLGVNADGWEALATTEYGNRIAHCPDATTPALALTAAALRARASQ